MIVELLAGDILYLVYAGWPRGFWKVNTLRKAATPSGPNISETNAQI